mmetsp:Transcript_66067/g.181102  ORF Transcript_66067/g.181102 Transcript_66067/m.181102 type:complete len:265 (-) Transcript_66067:237-1031(-)
MICVQRLVRASQRSCDPPASPTPETDAAHTGPARHQPSRRCRSRGVSAAHDKWTQTFHCACFGIGMSSSPASPATKNSSSSAAEAGGAPHTAGVAPLLITSPTPLTKSGWRMKRCAMRNSISSASPSDAQRRPRRSASSVTARLVGLALARSLDARTAQCSGELAAAAAASTAAMIDGTSSRPKQSSICAAWASTNDGAPSFGASWSRASMASASTSGERQIGLAPNSSSSASSVGMRSAGTKCVAMPAACTSRPRSRAPVRPR